MPRRHRAVLALALAGVLSACGSVGASGSPAPGAASPAAARPQSATAGGAAALDPPAAVREHRLIFGGPPQWLGYHGDPGRTGYAATTPRPGAMATGWQAGLDGQVYASPLVVGRSVIAATEGGSLYALDRTTGATLWRRHLHDAGTEGSRPCGNIDPEGITGTPAYDRVSGLLFAVVEQGSAADRQHVLYAVRAANGRPVWSRRIDPPGSDSAAMNQRGALTVANGQAYVPFGGRAGDCGNYHGSVVGVPLSGQGELASYVVLTERAAGIWTPPGATLAPDGSLYVSVGNGAAVADSGKPYDHSDSVLHLSPSLQLLDSFSPGSWAADNRADLDLGSAGPTLLASGVIYADGKSANAYTMDSRHLGGIGGQLGTAQVCASYGGTATVGDQVYVPCASGLQQVTVGATGAIRPGWKAAAPGSPVAGAGVVFNLDPAGTFYAYDPRSGAVLSSVPVGRTTRFATPALSGSWAFVPTLTGITAVRGV